MATEQPDAQPDEPALEKLKRLLLSAAIAKRQPEATLTEEELAALLKAGNVDENAPPE